MVESRENELKTIFNKYNKQLEDTNNPEMCISFCPFLLNNKLLIMPDCSIRKCSIFLDDNINNIATKINQIDDKSIKKLTWWTKEAL